jgi:D-alanyl-D-alanine carboxypeptidase (penicillin-binding protein 5/6)
MKRLLFACWAVVALAAAAQTSQPPELAVPSYLLMDVTSEQVLAQKNVDMPVEPASLTKLMSAYVVFDALRAGKVDLAQKLAVSVRASKMPGSRMFVEPGMQVPIEDLIKGMIVQSGNDATVALAEGVGGSVEHFVQLMNDQARALGLNNTSYRNPEGLSQPGHVTTARDLSVLASRLLRDFPQHMYYYAMKRYRYAGTSAVNDTNRNLLLFRDPSVDGLQTGQTDAAGYCVVATSQRQVPGLGQVGASAGSPEAYGARRLMAIVLGSSSANDRATEAQKLLNWGYTAFEVVRLFGAGQVVMSPAIWKGVEPKVDLGSPRPIVLTVPAGESARLSTQVMHAAPLSAPIAKGQRLALLKITRAGQVVKEVPLEALSAVEQTGLLGRAWDGLRLWIK